MHAGTPGLQGLHCTLLKRAWHSSNVALSNCTTERHDCKHPTALTADGPYRCKCMLERKRVSWSPEYWKNWLRAKDRIPASSIDGDELSFQKVCMIP